MNRLTSFVVMALLAAVIVSGYEPVTSLAQTDESEATVIPFDEDNWEFIGGAEVVEYLGEEAVTLGVKEEGEFLGFGMAMLRDTTFSTGIIKYHVAFDETRTFAGIQFRMEGEGASEDFYMRAHQSGNPDANQYMPNYNGIPSWQLHYGTSYSVPEAYLFNEWMPIKLVVAEEVADIYINDMETPALTVALKREELEGQVGLWGLNISGDVKFANFAITPMDDPEIVGTPEPESMAEPGTVLSWSVSNIFDAQSLVGKSILTEEDKADLTYTTLETDSRGIANLAKVQGVGEGQDTVFAKLTLESEIAQIKKVEFGFSDDVKVYLNDQILFEGSDRYLTRDYRFLGTVGFYDAVYLALEEGENELLFAITEDISDVTGWAVQARFEDTEAITLVEGMLAEVDRLEYQRQTAVDFLTAFYAGDVELADSILGEVYVQHSAAEDGREALLGVLEMGSTQGWLNPDVAAGFDPLRVVSEGDLAAMHYLDAGENKVYVDIFRFDDEGYIIEHWDVAQPAEEPNASGRTMIDGGGNPTVPTTPEELEQNKAVVRQLFDVCFTEGDASIVPELIREDYQQHNPGGQDGIESLLGLVDAFGGSIENTIYRMIAQGDLVYVHIEYPGLGLAAVDIFRLQDGLIAEHWDVLQPVPESLPHDNGFFGEVEIEE